MASLIPPAKKDDPEDVSWALTTAETQWSRGDKAEALKWLRRAVDAASDAEDDMRALELAKAAAELANAVGASGPPPLPAAGARKSVPPPAPAAARKSVPPKAPTGKSIPPRPAAGTPAKPTAVKVAAPVPSKPVVAKSTPPPKKEPSKEEKEENRKTARRSYAGEVQRGRAEDKESTKTNTSEMRFTGTSPAATDKIREPMPTKPPEAGAASTANDADSWPTETLAGDDLPLPNFEQERTRIGAAQYRADKTDEQRSTAKIRPLQAVKVMLFRGADGALRVAPAGSDVSAVAIEAMLVSLDPDVDLPSWLT